MGDENQYFFGPVRNWVNTGLLVSFRTLIAQVHLVILLHRMMWASFARRVNSVIIYSLSCCTKPVLICGLVLNTKEDILKKVGNPTVAGPH